MKINKNIIKTILTIMMRNQNQQFKTIDKNIGLIKNTPHSVEFVQVNQFEEILLNIKIIHDEDYELTKFYNDFSNTIGFEVTPSYEYFNIKKYLNDIENEISNEIETVFCPIKLNHIIRTANDYYKHIASNTSTTINFQIDLRNDKKIKRNVMNQLLALEELIEKINPYYDECVECED